MYEQKFNLTLSFYVHVSQTVISKLVVPHLEYLLRLRRGGEWDFAEWDDPPENRTALEYLFHMPSHPSRVIESSAWSKRVKSCFGKWSPCKTPTPPRILRSSFITWLRGNKDVPKEVQT
jgi:hypothetical protein